ncbi:uncharacterized protein SPAPADRAFT_60686 [Spathaspora passalidarum NRRL Y-27907]|uniref:Uncharacterized protein n=1 Tax=Spathaspora passalidarum (strain NRRL Y-27907 / 11-Y1) TaxID=619300 RepID=G3ALZ6_SPAPN|nr:uncharacterized protein SPAPADRAFT_60686 [Spathaspora passalidarum NRRL Y-27907]EGW33348.1 hypothetical protein SPAPADRAFT_60686 [Spathaspora passalidarum NRRL Y-27907]
MATRNIDDANNANTNTYGSRYVSKYSDYLGASSKQALVSSSLKKLPDNSMSSIDFHTSIPTGSFVEEAHERDIYRPTISTTNDSSTDVNVTPLKEAQFKILQTKLSMKAKLAENEALDKEIRNLDQPIYYKPPPANYEDSYYGIKSLLPPNIKLGNKQNKENKIPIIVSKPDEAYDTSDLLKSIRDQQQENDDIDDDFHADNPAGDWASPVVKEALARQVDLEGCVVRIFKNVIFLVAFLLIKSLAKKLMYLYDLRVKSQPYYVYWNNKYESLSDNIYLIVASKILVGIFVLNIIIPLIRIIKGQDQCYDLPLSEKQRQLIGLKVRDRPSDQRGKWEGIDEVDESAELTLKQRRYNLIHKVPYKKVPKYRKLNDYSIYKAKPVEVSKSDEASIQGPSIYPSRTLSNATQLTNTKPTGLHFLADIPKPIAKSKYSQEKIVKEKAKFAKNFNIDFNIADDE